MLNLPRLNALAARARNLYLSTQTEARPPAEQLNRWFRVTAAAGDQAATVFVYGDIGGWWGVDADELVREIHALQVDQLDVHINSYGGQMFDGFAIYSALRNHPATVTTWVDGVAASAASVIAMAGDQVVMEKPSRLMIHCSGTYASGNKHDLRGAADLLEEFDGSISEVYADRGKLSAAKFLEAMEAETWYSSAAALDVGLCDRVAGADTKTTGPESRASQLVRARARALAKTLEGVRK